MIPPSDIQADTKASTLSVAWNDHPTSHFTFHHLRDSCRCAQCVHEFTGEKLLDSASIPNDIHVRSMKLVGNYALKIVWSDGHETGLFTWERLRELCECGECRTTGP